MRVDLLLLTMTIGVSLLTGPVLAQWGALGAESDHLVMTHCGDKFDFHKDRQSYKQTVTEMREDREAKQFGYFLYVSNRAEE